MFYTLAPLVYYDRVDASHIKIGTGSWQVWLSKTKSFRYESFWGSFMACQENQGEDVIWSAYRRVTEGVRRVELGMSKDLTLEKLVDTAKRLKASNTSPWEGRGQTQQNMETCYYEKLETIPKTKTIQPKVIRQWCIFSHHQDGQVEFLGACWDKEQALNQMQQLTNSARSYEEASNYEMKEELVIPIGSGLKRLETNKLIPEARTKEIELLNQIAKLRQKVSELQKQLEQERYLNAHNHASVKYMWN